MRITRIPCVHTLLSATAAKQTGQNVTSLGGNKTKAANLDTCFHANGANDKTTRENTENDALKPWNLSGIFSQCYFSQQHRHLFKMFHESFIPKHTRETAQTPDRQLRHVKILTMLIFQQVKHPPQAVPGNSRPFPTGSRILQGWGILHFHLTASLVLWSISDSRAEQHPKEQTGAWGSRIIQESESTPPSIHVQYWREKQGATPVTFV